MSVAVGGSSNDAGRPLSLADKADTLDAVYAAVGDAATFTASLWLSYLFVLFYLLVAAAGVTQQDLLLENPVQLPFLDVKLPLQGFFAVGPLLFLIIHAYIMLHISMLLEKTGIFDEKLRKEVPADKQANVRRQLPNNIFVHFIAGPSESRGGLFGFLLGTIAWITLIIGPVCLLVFFQLQFLPFHSWKITNLQRIAVVIDLGLAWKLWPTAAHGGIIGSKFSWKSRTAKLMLAITGLASCLIIFVATFPGEWLYQTHDWPLVSWVRIPLVDGSKVDLASGKPLSFWPDRIVLVNFDPIDHSKFDTDEKYENVAATYSFRGRNLEDAFFSGDDFRKVDFTNANLAGANFNNANLRDAEFGCIDAISVETNQDAVNSAPNMGVTHGYGASSPSDASKFSSLLPDTNCTSLISASFGGADLRGADLTLAQLQYSNFARADLVAASLNYARLGYANFAFASLQNASLLFAQLEHANFAYAYLNGANLNNAIMTNTFLADAHIQGGSLDYADLEQASFSYADLQGASLRHATLTGTNFDEALIHGASFDYSTNAVVDKANTSALTSTQSWSKSDAALAETWLSLGCAPDSAPYILRNMISELTAGSPFVVGNTQQSVVSKELLENSCAGNIGLTDLERAQLEDIGASEPH